MTSKILKINDFDINRVSFSDPKKTAKSGQKVLVNYDYNGTRGPLIFQTPELSLPFGLDVKEYDDNVKYSLNFSLTNETDLKNPVAKFVDNLNKLDSKVRDVGTQESPKWFGSKKNEVIINEFFKPCVKRSQDEEKAKKYAPILQVKLAMYDNKPSFKLYDANKQEIPVLIDDDIDLTCLHSGCKLTCLIQCDRVYFMAGAKFGLTWKLVQAKVKPPDAIVGYSIVDDDDEEEEQEEEV